jgi:hypothetical protein
LGKLDGQTVQAFRKGISYLRLTMTSLRSSVRSFTTVYSPLLTLAVTILGLYAMAISIGTSMGARPVASNAGSYRIFFVPASVK